MSSKKSAKKKRSRAQKTESASAEHVVFGLLSELLARGVENGAYRWCLRKNADPERSVFIGCVPTEMPDGVICAIMARSLNRGLVEIIDAVKSEDSVYQSLLVQAEGKIDGETCPTLIRCEDCPLGYWIMVSPVEDLELPAAKLEPPVVNDLTPNGKGALPGSKASAAKTISSKDPTVKEQIPETKVRSSAKKPPTQEMLLQSKLKLSKQDTLLLGALEPSQVKEPLLVSKGHPLLANVPLCTEEPLDKGLTSTMESSSATKMSWNQVPPPSKLLPVPKFLPAVGELPPETKVLPSEKEAKGQSSQLNVVPPSQIKVDLSEKVSLPSAKVSSPPIAMTNQNDNHQTVLNGTDQQANLIQNRENVDTVFSNDSPTMNFETQDKIKFLVSKMPNATFDAVLGGELTTLQASCISCALKCVFKFCGLY